MYRIMQIEHFNSEYYRIRIMYAIIAVKFLLISEKDIREG